MYKNDNDKKLALLAAIFAMLLFTLVSCGKKMTELQGGAHDIAYRIYSRVGINAEDMAESDMTGDDAYILGLSEKEFSDNVTEAKIYRSSELSSGGSMCVMVSASESGAEAVFSVIYGDFEWQPCDPDECAVFMKHGKYVLLAKDSAEDIENISKAFIDETDGAAFIRFSQNPM